MKNRTLIALGCFALMLACGGSSHDSTPAIATGLSYTNPTGSGWRLVKSATSTPAHLVLDLLPPAGGTGSGVALTLGSETAKAAWARPSSTDGELVRAGAVYDLGAGVPAVVGTAKGANLVTVVSQKGAAAPAAYDGTKAVLSVALDYKGAGVVAGTVIPLTVVKAQHLPAAGDPAAVSVLVGALTAQ